MTLIRLPKETCARIAATAVSNARASMASRGWRSSSALSPMSDEGLVGIRTSEKYLMFQEGGIKPFIMFWVKGRTVPLGGKGGGTPSFRKGVGPGTPGYVNIPGKGRVWREQRWRHPGIAPQSFMHNAIEAAIRSEQSSIRADVMSALKGELK